MNASESDLDVGRLARLGAFDEPAIARIIVHFLETLDERIAAMAATAAAGDTRALIHQAHQLRGSAANCGFCGLAAACSALVSESSAFDAPAFRTLAGRARKAWQDARGH